MLDFSYYQTLTRDWIIAAFARLVLWMTHSNAIVCRGCGLEVQIETLNQHTLSGCLQCGETKLRAVRQC